MRLTSILLALAMDNDMPKGDNTFCGKVKQGKVYSLMSNADTWYRSLGDLPYNDNICVYSLANNKYFLLNLTVPLRL